MSTRSRSGSTGIPTSTSTLRERFGDLVSQDSDNVLRFFLQYHDRILYGTDVILDRRPSAVSAAQQTAEAAGYEKLLNSHWEYLSTDRTIEIADKLVHPVETPALHLPLNMLEDVYFNNAHQLLEDF